ncbi:competence/damage-inducible protein A [Vampirovibrio sp.]|uniref:competence/damage-inducible protein A n=1 Tax=Vampirovibrio sp. TaxID=2717857 RepID=UPI0035931189
MKAEIIAIGSELLIGDVINSNAAWISRELAALGVDVHYHVTVGDNPARIQGVIQQAIERSDLLIFTGGLGPTEDDLTMATLAHFFQTPLITDPESEQALRQWFMGRGLPLSDSNLKQAKKPQGAETIKNPVGTAPGVAWDVSDKTGRPTLLLTFPGVPKELVGMWPQGASWIRAKQRHLGEQAPVLQVRYLRFFGIGESSLGEALADLMSSANPTVAPYVGRAEVKIRIAAKADSVDAAEALMAPVKAEILKRCGDYYFGDDEATLEALAGQLLKASQLSVSVGESCTGGLLSSRLTDIAGSSAYTRLNVVTYANAEKTRLLGVSEDTLERHGAVSPQVAAEMAQGILKFSGSHLGVSITGIAGPDGGSEEKPVGLAYIGLARNQSVWVKKVLVNSRYSRQDIKHGVTQYALSYLIQLLKGQLESDVFEAGNS